MERDEMFERVAAARTYIGTARNQEHADKLELAAFMAIFHPDKETDNGAPARASEGDLPAD